MKTQRITLPPAPLEADRNIRHHYPIQVGKWIRHPATTPREVSVCRYTLDFHLDAAATVTIHVSADNRFELRCDRGHVGMGPDRSHIDYWSFHSYQLELDAGDHQRTADVVYLGLSATFRPWAQMCLEPGFILVAEDSPVDLDTGSAPWRVTLLPGVGTWKPEMKTFNVVGPNYTIDAADFFNPPDAVEPEVVRRAGNNNQSGTILPGWKLHPSRLPEQVREPVAGGTIRLVTDIAPEEPFPDTGLAEPPVPAQAWQQLVNQQGNVTVPAHTRLVVLWDLDTYRTAYPELATADGAGARVNIDWAESCYDTPSDAEDRAIHEKGHRDQVAGKYFRGNGDLFLPDGEPRTMRSFWWRAGRYIRLTVETTDQPLTIRRLRLIECRFPLENESRFDSSDSTLEPIIEMAIRGIQMCAHETYMDCPYYEQLMYVGDTRLQVLTAFVMSEEDRLNQRALELFDWSRYENGFVHERFPSQPAQLSCTFAMIWVLMVRDYAWWRDEADFVKKRLKGVRCLLEEFRALPDDHAPLLPALPGWSFIDWVPGLSFVNNPGDEAGVSSITNLLFLNSLVSAAELEEAFGDDHYRDHYRAWAEKLAAAIDETFWDENRSLFADDPEKSTWSEHAQCLALLSGCFPEREQACFEALITADDLSRATVYFSFYLLETLTKFGRGDLLLEKLDLWRDMIDLGMKTPMETPEPTRSDCHAWGSHPLFHLHASIAGIRPAGPGFESVRITPQPGNLTKLASTVPHPAGTVSLEMKLDGDTWQTAATLPDGVDGELHWQGETHTLNETTELQLPA
ncbi:MAG: alpha-L-rhamnosidase C-terminal domain-containing protein [Phycisphaeraceae bacterium]|nr:alpha-L-rhamnosidase C-terminal domain-containing protein [Phycisphaeraceae bacterium]